PLVCGDPECPPPLVCGDPECPPPLVCGDPECPPPLVQGDCECPPPLVQWRPAMPHLPRASPWTISRWPTEASPFNETSPSRSRGPRSSSSWAGAAAGRARSSITWTAF